MLNGQTDRHPFNGLFFENNLGKVEAGTKKDFNEARVIG